MLAVIDYGSGNIKAIQNIYERLRIPVRVAVAPADLLTAKKIILPGVGAFDQTVEQLDASGMRQALEDTVFGKGADVLGICVGMQLLASRSEEGSLPGLGWIDGTVRRFDESKFEHRTHLPHMGWNDVVPVREHPLFRGLDDGSRFYFLHSYYFECHSRDSVLAESDYGAAFTCAVNSGSVFGVQFHPEKSHEAGVKLLKNFAEF